MLPNILAVGLMSMGMGLSGVKDEPKNIRPDAQQTLILPGEYTYSNILYWAKQYIPEIDEENSPSQTVTYTFEDVQGTADNSTINLIAINWKNPHSYSNNTLEVEAHYDTLESSSLGVFKLNLQTKEFVSNPKPITLTTYPPEWEYYLQGEQPPEDTPMGNSIVAEIVSGLGIIGALATEFLGGFTALFYSSGNLTPFAIFSLVFLGIAVSFAIVKLVLNIIRGNTGA